MRILLLEDDAQLLELVSSYLSESYIVDTVSTYKDAQQYLKQMHYDIVLLDRNIHGEDIGMELISTIKNKNIKTGVIVISAYDTISDKVTGLNLGADDYLDKPFDNEELLARITALGRRNQPQQNLTIEGLDINTATKSILFENEEVVLSKKESELLFYLLSHRGDIISKEMLLNALYLHPEDISSNTIDATIKNIRKKLPVNIITTIKTRGYCVN
jgi:two-component system, OmpR family, response regulator